LPKIERNGYLSKETKALIELDLLKKLKELGKDKSATYYIMGTNKLVRAGQPVQLKIQITYKAISPKIVVIGEAKGISNAH